MLNDTLNTARITKLNLHRTIRANLKGSTAQTWCAASLHGIFPPVATCSHLLPPAYIYHIPQDHCNAHKLTITLDSHCNSDCGQALLDSPGVAYRDKVSFQWIFLVGMAKRIGFLRLISKVIQQMLTNLKFVFENNVFSPTSYMKQNDPLVCLNVVVPMGLEEFESAK